MIEPKTVSIPDIDGNEQEFIISKLPATVGREVIATYPVSAMPKIGEYNVNESIMLKMMGYVSALKEDGNKIPLTTRALIDNHCKDWQVLAKLEIAMLEYNTSFFGNGKISQSLDKFAQKVPAYLSQMLTDLLQQLSAKEKQHFKN